MTLDLLGLRTVIYPLDWLGRSQSVVDRRARHGALLWSALLRGYQVAGYELGLLPDGLGLLPDGDQSDGALTYWGVLDVQQAVDEALAAGATEHSPVTEVGDGITTATVRTPHGAILGLIYNPHFS